MQPGLLQTAGVMCSWRPTQIFCGSPCSFMLGNHQTLQSTPHVLLEPPPRLTTVQDTALCTMLCTTRVGADVRKHACLLVPKVVSPFLPCIVQDLHHGRCLGSVVLWSTLPQWDSRLVLR